MSSPAPCNPRPHRARAPPRRQAPTPWDACPPRSRSFRRRNARPEPSGHPAAPARARPTRRFRQRRQRVLHGRDIEPRRLQPRDHFGPARSVGEQPVHQNDVPRLRRTEFAAMPWVEISEAAAPATRVAEKARRVSMINRPVSVVMAGGPSVFGMWGEDLLSACEFLLKTAAPPRRALATRRRRPVSENWTREQTADAGYHCRVSRRSNR